MFELLFAADDKIKASHSSRMVTPQMTNLLDFFAGLSLRVAMFKRQKLLDTQRFLNDVTNKSSESVPIGSFNLQITGTRLLIAQRSRMILGSFFLHFCRFPLISFVLTSIFVHFADILDQLTVTTVSVGSPSG